MAAEATLEIVAVRQGQRPTRSIPKRTSKRSRSSFRQRDTVLGIPSLQPDDSVLGSQTAVNALGAVGSQLCNICPLLATRDRAES